MKSECGPERWCKITVVLIPSPQCRTGPFVCCEFKAKMKTSYYTVISVWRLYCAALRQYNELRKLRFHSFPLASQFCGWEGLGTHAVVRTQAWLNPWGDVTWLFTWTMACICCTRHQCPYSSQIPAFSFKVVICYPRVTCLNLECS